MGFLSMISLSKAAMKAGDKDVMYFWTVFFLTCLTCSLTKSLTSERLTEVSGRDALLPRCFKKSLIAVLEFVMVPGESWPSRDSI